MAVRRAKENMVVAISFSLRDEKGLLLDQATPNLPLKYIHGRQMILPALERALEGSTHKDRFELTIEPEEAYGPYEARKCQEIPRSAFPEDLALQVGMPFQLQMPGSVFPTPFFVKEIKEKEGIVHLDGNHPFAGKTLCFDVTVERVRRIYPQEKALGRPFTDEELESYLAATQKGPKKK